MRLQIAYLTGRLWSFGTPKLEVLSAAAEAAAAACTEARRAALGDVMPAALLEGLPGAPWPACLVGDVTADTEPLLKAPSWKGSSAWARDTCCACSKLTQLILRHSASCVVVNMMLKLCCFRCSLCCSMGQLQIIFYAHSRRLAVGMMVKLRNRPWDLVQHQTGCCASCRLNWGPLHMLG